MFQGKAGLNGEQLREVDYLPYRGHKMQIMEDVGQRMNEECGTDVTPHSISVQNE